MSDYSVNLWGSHPDDGNDDCHTGADFSSEAEALAAYANPAATFRAVDLASTAYVELSRDCGPHPKGGRYVETVKVRKNPDYKPGSDDDSDWRREMAMQAGMAWGCDGYNDAYGY